MNETLYLSRSFVEFGPFPIAEMLSFHTRGLLKDSDYVRSESSDDWIHVYDWAATVAVPAPKPVSPPAKKAAKPAAKKAAAKKAPAKKAAKKSA